MNLPLFFSSEVSLKICMVLLHSLWLVALFVFLAWLIERMRPKQPVSHSHCVYVVALLLSVCALPVTYAMLDTPSYQIEIAERQIHHAPETAPVKTPVANDAVIASSSLTTEQESPAVSRSDKSSLPSGNLPTVEAEGTWSDVWISVVPWLAAAYAAGVALMFVRLLRSIWCAERLRSLGQSISEGPTHALLVRLSQQCNLRVVPRLAIVEEVVVPKVVGLLKPTILIPASAVSGLSPEELEVIISHELAHIRRHDMWIQLLQRIAEVVLFFNPALWLLSRRISALREYCCDEVACDSLKATSHEPQVRYAQTLLRMVELAPTSESQHSQAATLALSGRSPSELRRRVARLFGEPLSEPLRLSRGGLLALVGAMLLLALAPLTKSQADSEESASEQLITFPTERAVGVVYSRPSKDSEFGYRGHWYSDWQQIGAATGEVRVPKNHHVRLDVSKAASKDLAFLSTIDPSSIAYLNLEGTNIDDEQLRHVGKLVGLLMLGLEETKITDNGFEHLDQLKSVRRLDLSAWGVHEEGFGVGDGAMAVVAQLPALESIALRLTKVTDQGMAELAKCKTLRSISIPGTAVTDQGLTSLLALPKLSSLGLGVYDEGAQVTDEGMETIGQMTELEHLELSGTEVSGIGLKQISQLKQLKSLSIDNTKITEAGLAELKPLQNLENLRCYTIGIGDEGAQHLGQLLGLKRISANMRLTNAGVAKLAKLPNLEQLSLSGSKITDAAIGDIAKMKSLKELWFQDCQVTDEGIALLRDLSTIEALLIHETGMTTDGLESLATLSKLKRLNLDISQIEGKQQDWSALSQFKQIEHLTIRGESFSDDDLVHLEPLTQLERIVLEIPGGISDAGIKRVRNFRRLQSARIEQSVITDAGLKAFVDLDQLTNLTISCLATDEGLLTLRELESLSYLQIGSPYVTEEGVTALAEASPSLQETNKYNYRLDGSEVTPSSKDAYFRKGSAEARVERDELEDTQPPLIFADNWMNVDGEVELESLRGKVVLVDIWGAWCGPCQRQLPMLKSLYQQYRPRGLEIVGIHSTKRAEGLADFVQKESIPWPIAVDRFEQTKFAWKAESYPSYYLIDRAGNVRVADIFKGHLETAIIDLLSEESNQDANNSGAADSTPREPTHELASSDKPLLLDDRFVICPVTTDLQRSLLSSPGDPLDRASVCVLVNAAAFTKLDEIDENSVDLAEFSSHVQALNQSENDVLRLRLIDPMNGDFTFEQREQRMENLNKLLSPVIRQIGFGKVRVSRTFGVSGPPGQDFQWREFIEQSQQSTVDRDPSKERIADIGTVRVGSVQTFLARQLSGADCVVDVVPIVRDSNGARFVEDLLPIIKRAVENIHRLGGEKLLIRLRYSETAKQEIERWTQWDSPEHKIFAKQLGFQRVSVSQSAIAQSEEAITAPPEDRPKEYTYPLNVSGRALDLQGQPISGATIYLGAQSPGYRRLAETKTDARGWYRFENVDLPIKRADTNRGRDRGGFEVFGIADGYALAWRDRKYLDPTRTVVGDTNPSKPLQDRKTTYGREETVALDITFSPPTGFRGRVVDHLGKPIVGASVAVRYCDREWNRGRYNVIPFTGTLHSLNGRATVPPAVKSRTTDEDGRFEYTGLPPDYRWEVEIRAKGYSARDVWYVTNSAEPELSESQDGINIYRGDAVITFDETHAVTFRVLYGDTGEPADRVGVAGEGFLVTTDKQGLAKTRLSRNKHTIALSPRYGTPYLWTRQQLDLTKEVSDEPITYRIDPAAIVDITVVDEATGAPLRDVDVWWDEPMEGRSNDTHRNVRGYRSWEVETRISHYERPRTDADGKVRLLFPPGEFRVGVGLDAYPKGYRSGVTRGQIISCTLGKPAKAVFKLKSNSTSLSKTPILKSTLVVRPLLENLQQAPSAYLNLWREKKPDESEARNMSWTDRKDGTVWIRHGSAHPNDGRHGKQSKEFAFAELPPGRYCVTAASYRPGERVPDPTPFGISKPIVLGVDSAKHEIDVIMQGSRSLTVQVKDEKTEQPIKYFRLKLSNSRGVPIVHGHGSGSFFERTSAAGEVQYRSLPPGTYQVQVLGKRATVNNFVEYAAPFASPKIDLDDASSRPETLTYNASPYSLNQHEIDKRFPFSIFGSATDDEGTPLANVTVRAATGMGTLMGGGSVTTDDEGKYRLYFGPGMRTARDEKRAPQGVGVQAAHFFAEKSGWKLKADEGYLFYLMTDQTRGHFEQMLQEEGGKYWGKDSSDEVIFANQPRELNLVLVADSEQTQTNAAQPTNPGLKVTIVGPDDNPVGGVIVEIRGLSDFDRSQLKVGEFIEKRRYGTSVRADDAGRLELDLGKKQPQRLSLHIKQPGYGPYWANWDASDHPQPIPTEFTARLERGWSVGGVVVDEDGQPIAGAKVRPSIEYKKRPGDTSQMGAGARTTTAEDGTWQFDSVPDSYADVTVEITHPGHSTVIAQLARDSYEVAREVNPTEKTIMPSGLSVTGRVTDSAGQPISGAQVRTKFHNDVRSATTDETGRYRLVGCKPNMARIVVSAPGKAMELQEIRVDQEMAPVNFVLQDGGKIRVKVVDENGVGIPKARIFFQSWRGRIDYFEFDHVDQYANDQGIWEWNEAPLDEFEADICRPGGMQLTYQKLQARDEEYIFSPPPKLEISGKVTDAKTGKPIEKFRVVRGLRNKNPRIGIDWIEYDVYDATDGAYRVTFDRVPLAALVRVEANGYRVKASRDIEADEGQVDLSFELEGETSVASTIVTPEGKPAVEAKIALGVAGSQINIADGDIGDGQTYAKRLSSDQDGQFELPARDDPFQLVITHNTGFAHLKSSDGPIPDRIKLTAWARIEGVFRVGTKPVPEAVLELYSEGIHSYGPDVPNIFTHHNVTTGPDGTYVFERVFPGKGRVGRRILLMVNEGATEVTSSLRTPATFIAGETTTLDLGGTGRPVVGKLLPPENYESRVLWNFALVNLESDLVRPKSPTPPDDVTNDVKKRAEWWNAWNETPDGKAWSTAYKKWQAAKDVAPYLTASVDRDGSFRLDDTPPGNYVLRVRYDERLPGTLEQKINVPPRSEGNSPVDLGDLRLQLRDKR